MEWETGLGQKFKGRLFFKEEILFKEFKKYNKDQPLHFTIKFNKDNSKLEVLINNEPLEIQNFRIYKNDENYKDSYQ